MMVASNAVEKSTKQPESIINQNCSPRVCWACVSGVLPATFVSAGLEISGEALEADDCGALTALIMARKQAIAEEVKCNKKREKLRF